MFSVVHDGVRSAIAAVTFLTAAPAGRGAAIEDRDLRSGLPFFPLVGALVGALVALVGWAAAAVLPAFVAGVLGVATGVVVTAALHLDGLADTADGVGAALAGRDPAPVMADPRLGTFGGAALVLDLLLKVSILAALVAGSRFPLEAIAAGALGRASVLALAVAFPYAGPPDGVGAWTGAVDRRRAFAGLALGATIGIGSAGARFVPMVLAAAVACALVGRWSERHLRGMRGDTFGATTELSETLGLAAALATL